MDIEVHGHCDGGVSQEFADGLGVGSTLDAASGKGMSQGVEVDSRDGMAVKETLEVTAECADFHAVFRACEQIGIGRRFWEAFQDSQQGF